MLGPPNDNVHVGHDNQERVNEGQYLSRCAFKTTKKIYNIREIGAMGGLLH